MGLSTSFKLVWRHTVQEQMVISTAVYFCLSVVCSGGLNKNGPRKFACLNTWSPNDGTVWERVGGVYYWRCALEAGF